MYHTPTYRPETKILKFYYFKCTTICFDGVVRETISNLITESISDAGHTIGRWNRQGQGKYVYELTGVTKELTREEVKKLKTYEGTDTLYLPR
jgi:hypothetical protein